MVVPDSSYESHLTSDTHLDNETHFFLLTKATKVWLELRYARHHEYRRSQADGSISLLRRLLSKPRIVTISRPKFAHVLNYPCSVSAPLAFINCQWIVQRLHGLQEKVAAATEKLTSSLPGQHSHHSQHSQHSVATDMKMGHHGEVRESSVIF